MCDPVDQLINNYPGEIQAVTHSLHGMVKTGMPNTHESIYHGALSCSIGASVFERLVYPAPRNNDVRFGFYFGVPLPDPQYLMIGEGKCVRHMKIASLAKASRRSSSWCNLPGIKARPK